jgi:hypothetical protein
MNQAKLQPYFFKYAYDLLLLELAMTQGVVVCSHGVKLPSVPYATA